MNHRVTCLLRVLSDMAIKESLELVTFRRHKAAPGAPKESCIIFDTSFLMLDSWPQWFDHFMIYARQKPLVCRTIVPAEVYEELVKHMASEEKSQAARVARKRFAKLVEIGCEEPSLAHLELSSEREGLGADSPTDRKLVAYAASLTKDANTYAVFLATDDGGILLDIARLRRKEIPVFAITKEMSEGMVRDNICASLAISAPSFLAGLNVEGP